MADWNQPTLGSAYADFLNFLAARDLDVATFFNSLPTNPSTNMMRFERTGDKFQEYLAGSWTDTPIGIAGGGTGGATAVDARTNLGLGDMATQSSSAVAITGGSISGISFNASVITAGNFNPARMPVGGSWATLTSQLTLSGHATKLAGFGIGYRTGGNTTLADTDGTYVCTGGTVIAPDASAITGRIFYVKRNGTTVTLTGTGGQTFDGANSVVLSTDLDVVGIEADGANWKIISGGNSTVVRQVVTAQAVWGGSPGPVAYNFPNACADYTKCNLWATWPDSNGSGIAVRPISNTQFELDSTRTAVVTVNITGIEWLSTVI